MKAQVELLVERKPEPVPSLDQAITDVVHGALNDTKESVSATEKKVNEFHARFCV